MSKTKQKKTTDDDKVLKKINLFKAQVMAMKSHKGKDFFFDPGQNPHIKRIELDLLSFNKVLSNKWGGEGSGFPMGKIFNFYGPESIGKSAFASQVAAKYLENGHTVLWVDKEDSFEADYYYNTFGIDAINDPRFMVVTPDTIEASIDVIHAAIENDIAKLIVVDSVAALGAAADMESEAGKDSYSAVTRRLAKHFQYITGKLSRHDISVIYINQLRANIGFGVSGRKSTGGNPMKFFSHVTLRFNKRLNITAGSGESSTYLGTEVMVEGEKNKTAFPHIKKTVSIYPGEGFSKESDIMNLAASTGIIKVSGSWYAYGDLKIQGAEKFRGILKNDAKLFNEIKEKVIKELEVKVDKNTGEILDTAA